MPDQFSFPPTSSTTFGKDVRRNNTVACNRPLCAFRLRRYYTVPIWPSIQFYLGRAQLILTKRELHWVTIGPRSERSVTSLVSINCFNNHALDGA
jgi:hypothetical protein